MKYFIYIIIAFLYSCNSKELENTTQLSPTNSSENSLVAIVQLDEKFGAINLEGKEIVPPIYKKVHLPSEGLFSVERFEDDGTTKWGFYDFEGNLKIPFQFDKTSFFVNGLAPVRINNKWGYINKQGDLVIDTIYDNAEHFGCGRGKVTINGKIGFIDTLGNMTIPTKLSYAQRFYDGFSWVNGGKDKKNLIDINGNYLIDTSFHVELKFSEFGITKISKQSFEGRTKYGYINTKGEIIIPVIYDDGGYFFGDKFAYVGKLKNEKMRYAFINSDNQLISNFKYENAGTFYKGIATVAKGSKNAKTTKFKFEDNEIEHKDGFKKYGAINTNGQLVIPFKYDNLSIGNAIDKENLFPTEAVLIATIKDKKGVIDTNMKKIIPIEYDDLFYSGKGLFQGIKGKEDSVIDSNGKVIFKSETINVLWQIDENPEFFSAIDRNTNLRGVIDLNGNWIIEPKYDYINFFQNNKLVI